MSLNASAAAESLAERRQERRDVERGPQRQYSTFEHDTCPIGTQAFGRFHRYRTALSVQSDDRKSHAKPDRHPLDISALDHHSRLDDSLQSRVRRLFHGLEMSRALSRKNQFNTLLLLIFGYAAYFFTRSPLNTVTPSIVQTTLPLKSFGNVLATGYFGYALGYVVNGYLCDLLGAKVIFVSGLLGASSSMMGFLLNGSAVWMGVMWFLARFFQAAGRGQQSRGVLVRARL